MDLGRACVGDRPGAGILEAADLVKKMEETFGVSAAAVAAGAFGDVGVDEEEFHRPVRMRSTNSHESCSPAV